jgi:hypothetical protein
MALDCPAALAASSWGLSQLTGVQYQFAGFTSVDEFIRAQMASERAQLDTLVMNLKNRRLVEPLQSRDWATFARGYFGPSYAEFHYDQRLADAYPQYQEQP